MREEWSMILIRITELISCLSAHKDISSLRLLWESGTDFQAEFNVKKSYLKVWWPDHSFTQSPSTSPTDVSNFEIMYKNVQGHSRVFLRTTSSVTPEYDARLAQQLLTKSLFMMTLTNINFLLYSRIKTVSKILNIYRHGLIFTSHTFCPKTHLVGDFHNQATTQLRPMSNTNPALLF